MSGALPPIFLLLVGLLTAPSCNPLEGQGSETNGTSCTTVAKVSDDPTCDACVARHCCVEEQACLADSGCLACLAMNFCSTETPSETLGVKVELCLLDYCETGCQNAHCLFTCQ